MWFRVKYKWVVLWSLWAARLVRQPSAPLRVAGGLLRGSVAHDGSHTQYLAVPYASVAHRFQDPQPYPPWDGVLDLFDEHIKCTQRYMKNVVAGREDCLVLNVHTPLRDDNSLRPVMVFIHGGGFRDGSGSTALYGPEYLVKHDVILVTFNYRLEVLGFLCLGIKEAPGNVGLKDQVAALKWIQRNIRAFGGDPDNVTLFGESAGSASVLYHVMSPMSVGLFNRVIMQSGSAISHWSFQFDPVKTASALVQQFGYHTEDPKEIYEVLRHETAETLMSTRVPRAKGDVILSENIFVPCLEKKIPGVERFLPDYPYNLLLAGKYQKVPMIIGYNNAEGYMFVGKENDTTLSNMNFHGALNRDLFFPTEDERVKTGQKLQELYMGNERVTKETLQEFSHFEGDLSITYPVIATIDLLLRTNDRPVYSYMFSYDGWLNIAKIYFGFGACAGATHADDLFYMFKPKITFISALFETDMVDRVTTMWTNFAKFGNPTPETNARLPNWKPTDSKDPRVLVIDREYTTVPLWNKETVRFLNKTYSKYRRKE